MSTGCQVVLSRETRRTAAAPPYLQPPSFPCLGRPPAAAAAASALRGLHPPFASPCQGPAGAGRGPQQLYGASFHVGYYVPPSVRPGDRYGGLEYLWNQNFELLFRNLPNMWSFGPTETPRTVGWFTFKDMAKVRFFCQHCCHGWTSMYGLVVFYYRWDGATNQGHVRFLLTGQKCSLCISSRFETPMWYPEEAQKVMTNLYHEVAGRIYRLRTPPPITVRRHGRPRHQHNSHMCEGCFQGLCKRPMATPPTSS